MGKNKLVLASLGLASVLTLAACGGKSNTAKTSTESKSDKFSVVQITDGGNVDDKSFNQSAWEGLQKWGADTGKKKGTDGFNYIQPSGEAEYATVYTNAVKAKYDLIFGVGYQLQEAGDTAAAKYPDSHFVSVDAVLKDLPNTASLMFSEQEAAFLAGVAAARTSKTNHVGFIGGTQSETIVRFESGFVAGAKSVNKDITVDRQFVGSFSDSATANILANTMYTNGADVIYTAAGGSGLGAFSSATANMAADPSKTLWVIGVDMDQEADGQYKTASGETKSVTLASTLKKVGDVMVKFIEETQKNGFKNGVQTFTLKDGGVDLTDGHLTDDVKAEVAKAKKSIIAGDIVVPKTTAELDAFLAK